jgi:DUF438 domain-containing protein
MNAAIDTSGPVEDETTAWETQAPDAIIAFILRRFHEPLRRDLPKLARAARSLEVIDLVLRHLPLDLSFVDENDVVRYYSESKERIFPRTPAAIGRTVQNCHPPRSVHTVNRILESFRAGKKNVAAFWIPMGPRFIHIRYFAVRDGAGKYRGCLEVTQDIGEIRALEGERRLLDWKD